MSELKKRKVPTAEFKAKVGLEAVRGVKTINEISQRYRVHPTQVGLWKKEILEQAKTLFEACLSGCHTHPLGGVCWAQSSI
jgi:transposase-like protein